MCTVRDIVDPAQDEQLASFVVDSHMRSHPDSAELLEYLSAPATVNATNDQLLSQDMLRKYIIYARHNCNPKLNSINTQRIAKVYAQLREISRVRHISNEKNLVYFAYK